MKLRLHEVHPSLVHLPLVLAPLALAFDLVGRITGRRSLMDTGRTLMPVAAVSAGLAGAAGLAAQEAVRAEGRAHDLLKTHRTLNVGLIGLLGGMAVWRAAEDEPGIGYLLLGLAGVGTMSYTAYLGGKMVYEHAVGVEPSGIRETRSPEIVPGNLGNVARVAATNIAEGAVHSVKDMTEGSPLPALTERS